MSLFRTLRVSQALLGQYRQRVVLFRTLGALSALQYVHPQLQNVPPPQVLGQPDVPDLCEQYQRWMSTETVDPDAASVDYEGLLALLESGDIQLIDVREPEELEECGQIEKAFNIPLGEVETALDMDPERFREAYKFAMPKHSDANIVFTCLGGIRSAKALGTAISLGYDKARHYPGGWEEWTEKQGLPLTKTEL